MSEILWIDDELSYLRHHIRQLETASHKVTQVKTANEALDLIRSQKGEWPYLLTIVDIEINDPGRGLSQSEAEDAGLEILRELSRSFPKAEVLIVSGVLSDLDESRRRATAGYKQRDKITLGIDTLSKYVERLK